MAKEKKAKPEPKAESGTRRGEMFDARFEMNELFAKKARNARTNRKLSLDALNIGIREKTGIDIGLQRLSRFERGLSLPSPAELWALTAFYGVNMTWMANPNDRRGVEDRTPDEAADLKMATKMVEQLGPEEAIRRLMLAPPAAAPASTPAGPEMPRAADPEPVIRPEEPTESPPASPPWICSTGPAGRSGTSALPTPPDGRRGSSRARTARTSSGQKVRPEPRHGAGQSIKPGRSACWAGPDLPGHAGYPATTPDAAIGPTSHHSEETKQAVRDLLCELPALFHDDGSVPAAASQAQDGSADPENFEVPLLGDVVEVVQHNGGEFVVINKVCENLGIDPSSQRAKLGEAAWATKVIITLVAKDGKRREVATIPLDQLPIWLATMTTGKIHPDLRPKIEEYQSYPVSLPDAVIGPRPAEI